MIARFILPALTILTLHLSTATQPVLSQDAPPKRDGWADVGARFENAKGAVIRELAEDSSGAKAGLKVGDVVVALNGKAVDSGEAMVDGLLRLATADAVKLRVRRGDQALDFEFAPDKIGGQKIPGVNNSVHHPPALRARPVEKKEGRLAYVIPFNVSLGWAATKAEGEQVTKMLQEAARFFYDATEGQIAFGAIEIFDNKERWDQVQFRLRKSKGGGILGIEHVTPGGICVVTIQGPLESWGASMVFAHEACHQILGCGDEYRYAPTDPAPCPCMMGDDCQQGKWDLCTRKSHTYRMKESCWQNVKRWYPNLEEIEDPKPGPELKELPPIVRHSSDDGTRALRDALMKQVAEAMRESRERLLRDLDRMLEETLRSR